MFDFYKEVIINSDTLPIEEGVDAKGKPFKRFYAFPGDTLESEAAPTQSTLSPKDDEKIFRVLRCADYVKKGFVDGIVYKTVGHVGVNATAEFDLSTLEEGSYRLLVDISLVNRYYSDYQHPWSEYHKPIMVEFTMDDTQSAEDVAELLQTSIKKYIPSDYRYAYATVEGSKLTINCTDPYQVIKSAKVQVQVEDGCIDGCSAVEYEDFIDATIVANAQPFATGEWLTENLRFPTYPNLRYASPNLDERPIPGAIYTQFSFGYCSPRRGLTGQGTVGQMLASVTHHVFYVHNDLAKAFEDALKEVLGEEGVEEVESTNTVKLTILNGRDPLDKVVTFKTTDLNAGVALRVNFAGPTNKADVTNYTSFELTTDGDYIISENKLTSTEAKEGDTGKITASYKGVKTTVDFKVVEG